MSTGTERANIYQAIQTLPDQFLPDLAEFIVFLQLKAQQKINVWPLLSNQSEVETKQRENLVTQVDLLEKAAQVLRDDYTHDKELTALLSLDGEDFYA
jgi:hypothetical protein